jgi:hypothetical protein
VDIGQGANVDKAATIERSLQELFSFVEDLEQQVRGNQHSFQQSVDKSQLASPNEPISNSEFWLLDD